MYEKGSWDERVARIVKHSLQAGEKRPTSEYTLSQPGIKTICFSSLLSPMAPRPMIEIETQGGRPEKPPKTKHLRTTPTSRISSLSDRSAVTDAGRRGGKQSLGVERLTAGLRK